MGETAYAEEMLERCLYALEMAWHPWFSPQAANCRLDYSLPANRPMFSALFKHMQVRTGEPSEAMVSSACCELGAWPAACPQTSRCLRRCSNTWR